MASAALAIATPRGATVSVAPASRLASRASPMVRGAAAFTPRSWIPGVVGPAGQGAVVAMAKKGGKKGGKKKGGQKKGPGSLMDLPPRPKYQEGEVIMLSLSLIESYFRKSEKRMFDGEPDITKASQILYEAPFALLAFDETEARVCTYANEKALSVLDATWDDLVGKPLADGPAGGEAGGCVPGMVEAAGADGFGEVEGGSLTSAKGTAVGGVGGAAWRIERVYGEEGEEVEEDGVGVRLDTWDKEGDAAEGVADEAEAAAPAAESA